MDKEKRIQLTRDFPKFKCLRCEKHTIEKPCKENLEPLTCGRSFDPPGGGLVKA